MRTEVSEKHNVIHHEFRWEPSDIAAANRAAGAILFFPIAS